MTLNTRKKGLPGAGSWKLGVPGPGCQKKVILGPTMEWRGKLKHFLHFSYGTTTIYCLAQAPDEAATAAAAAAAVSLCFFSVAATVYFCSGSNKVV